MLFIVIPIILILSLMSYTGNTEEKSMHEYCILECKNYKERKNKFCC
jgi:hypothetical protein